MVTQLPEARPENDDLRWPHRDGETHRSQSTPVRRLAFEISEMTQKLYARRSSSLSADCRVGEHENAVRRVGPCFLCPRVPPGETRRTAMSPSSLCPHVWRARACLASPMTLQSSKGWPNFR